VSYSSASTTAIASRLAQRIAVRDQLVLEAAAF